MPANDPPSKAEIEFRKLMKNRAAYSRWAERVRAEWLARQPKKPQLPKR